MPAKFFWSFPSFRPIVAFTAMVFAVSLPAVAQIQEPLHQRIDRLVNAAPLGPVAAVCSDAEFLRRISLDLNGMTVTGSEAKAFLDDPAPDKRQKLIDKLLASPRFARHLANTFDVALMERRADAHVPSPEWQKYLYESFLTNKPYDQLVREIIAADGVDPANRPASKFFLDRTAEPNLVTRDIGRLFFGRDLQCAQCHDSPLVNDFLQSDYYGVQAFVVRTVMFNDAAAKKQFLGEKADGDVAFTSVFTKESGVSAPRVPAGTFVEDPLLPIGEEYNVKPTDNTRPVPKYSRRAKLAEAITTTNNPQFNRNIANRLWAMMLGRGIVHPLDLHHSDNPATHPELLDLLTAEIVAAKYDVKTLLREIALTQTYQRSGELPLDWNGASQQAAALLATLDAKQKEISAAIDQSKEAAKPTESEFDAVKKAVAPVRDELTKITTAAVEARKQFDAAADVVAKTDGQIAPKTEAAKPLAEIAAKAGEALAKIPGDADLKKATEFFQARATALNNEVVALTKARETQVVAAKTKQDAFATAAAAINPVREKWMAEKAKLDAAREKAEAAAVGIRTINANRNVVAHRITGLKTLAGYNEQVAKAAASQAVLVAKQTELVTAQTTLTQAADEAAKAVAQKTVADVTALLATTQQQAKSDADQLAATREQVLQFCIEHFYVASLKPLTPEQLTASTLSATGYIDMQTKTANAEIDKAAQTAAAANPPVQVAVPLGGRERQVEEHVSEKLIRANAGPFIAMFGGGAGQPQDVFYATADQALFYGNGGTIHNWAGVLATPLSAQKDSKLLAEEMYLHVFNRRPTDDEIVLVTTHLQSRADVRVPAIQEMVWGLLSSAEFRFNH
ncbi:MAG: DUF1553 domain-containing protein [Planctomycetota bacterium]|nr:MAG: DUF1553 domain-containing protein [Planctomycetota bacterium]